MIHRLFLCTAALAAASVPAQTVDGVWRQLDGSASSWGISNDPLGGEEPAVILDTAGMPVVAWVHDAAHTAEIYIKRYDGQRWVELSPGSAAGGGVSNTPGGISLSPQLASDGRGTIFLAWQEFDQNWAQGNVFVKVWNGLQWFDAGAGSSSGLGVTNLTGNSDNLSFSLAADSDGLPAVAFSWRRGTESGVAVRRFDGRAWVDLPPLDTTRPGVPPSWITTDNPLLRIAPQNQVTLAWTSEISYLSEIDSYEHSTWLTTHPTAMVHIRRLADGGWAPLAPSADFAAVGEYVFSMDLATSAGAEMLLALSGDAIRAGRWNGAQWLSLGGSLGGTIVHPPAGEQIGEVVIEADAQGLPTVAWMSRAEGEDNDRLLIARWSGAAWEEIGTGSSTSPGLCDPLLGVCSSPSLVLGADGEPLVAWEAFVNGVYQVWLRTAGPGLQ